MTAKHQQCGMIQGFTQMHYSGCFINGNDSIMPETVQSITESSCGAVIHAGTSLWQWNWEHCKRLRSGCTKLS